MQKNLGHLIHDIIKKIYPELDGGFTFRQNEEKFDDALFWESTKYPKPTFEQIEKILPIIELEQAKQIKIKQLKENRNQRLLKVMKFTKAFEIVFDDQGLDVITNNEVFFEFRVTSTGQPATEPNSLLLNAITKTGDKYIRYSCVIIEGENSRKGYIQLNSVVANNLLNHIEQRNTDYIKLSNDLETEINNCLTLEEVKNIDINING